MKLTTTSMYKMLYYAFCSHMLKLYRSSGPHYFIMWLMNMSGSQELVIMNP